MTFEDLKQKQSVIWGSGPYERLPAHYAPLLEHLARVLEPRAGERILDVAAGTGALTTILARSGADVIGLDFASALVDTARRLATDAGVSVRFEVGDAEALPFADESFDVVASSVGTMFAPDHNAVAGELARVCRPGGRLGLANWSAERGVVDMFKAMATFQPPPPEGVGNPFAWGDRAYCEQLLGDAFDLRFEEGDAPQTGESGEQIWQLFSTVYGPTRTLAESLDAERREELHRAFVAFYEEYRIGEDIHQPRPYLIVLGTRRG